MIGVVIPARNEERLLPSCLRAVLRAAGHPALCGERVLVCVVLDACTDGSLEAVRTVGGASVLTLEAGTVGAARAAGAAYVFEAGARWLSCTDADTRVGPDWLSCQLAAGAELVCGTVEIDDWALHPPAVRSRFLEDYRDAHGHRHIHGANLGISREAYMRAGGFQPIAAHEDVALVRAAERAGIQVAWSAAPRAVTSSRLDGRAPEGFAADLRRHHVALKSASRPAPTLRLVRPSTRGAPLAVANQTQTQELDP